MGILKIVLFTLLVGYLCGVLIKIIRQGLHSGTIGYIDAKRRCERSKQPWGYWTLVFFFGALATVLAATWVWAVLRAIGVE